MRISDRCPRRDEVAFARARVREAGRTWASGQTAFPGLESNPRVLRDAAYGPRENPREREWRDRPKACNKRQRWRSVLTRVSTYALRSSSASGGRVLPNAGMSFRPIATTRAMLLAVRADVNGGPPWVPPLPSSP